ncbi:MAG: C_GCAxxG_C_C family protein [Bacteroidales bacterium]|nr:C_GCAxxG_C_C family protein [Bacteroidales bacterium]
MVQKRAEMNFVDGYNCCQSVVLAFEDCLFMTGEEGCGAGEKPVPREVLVAMSSGFGGGMGRMREVCGAVSGMVTMAGFIKPSDDPSDMGRRTENYALVQEFAVKFREAKGSIICRELLALAKERREAEGKAAPAAATTATDHAAATAKREMEAPRPSERTPEYYRTRPCTLQVGTAARIVADYLLSHA